MTFWEGLWVAKMTWIPMALPFCANRMSALQTSSFPAAHLGNPNKFDCLRFGHRFESEKLQF